LFVAALSSPAVRDIITGAGTEILAQGPEEFAALLRDDYPRWAEVVRRGNIHVE